jgi:anaerobic magnesium-protoporphyrin IX monomethyl ester cyclase
MRINGPIVLYQPRDHDRVLPLGLLHVGSALAGQPVALVDGRLDLAPEARVAELAREALCVGVSVRTGAPIADALRVTRAVRAARPGLPVVWGGAHPTYRTEECLAPDAADFAAVDWGERTLVELVGALREREPVEGLAGLARGREGALVESRAREREEVVRFPPADYGLLDLEVYFRWMDARRLDYCSSRGRAGSESTPFSALPAERVVTEIVALVRRHRVTEVAFRDEDFFGEPRRAEAIGRGLLERSLHVAWSGTGQASILSRQPPELLRALAGSGCRQVRVVVAGDLALDTEPGVLLLETAERLHRAGIGGRFSFTAGVPGRGKSELAAIHRTARAIRRIDRRFETPIRLYAPYPGSGPIASDTKVPRGLLEWAGAGLDTGAFVSRELAEAAHRYDFFLSEANRPPARRLAKRLLRGLARVRVRLGFYAFDVERRLVEGLARLRGRARRPAFED